MNTQLPSPKVPLAFARFFKKVLVVLKPPYLIFLFALAVVLVAVLVVVNDIWRLIPAIVVLVIFAFLGTALYYNETRLRYAKRTEEEFKKALRETVMELQKERAKSARSKPSGH